METQRTYTLEDNATGYAPNAHRPEICDNCYMGLYPRLNDRVNWKVQHAIKNSPYRFEHIDYIGADNSRCWCCHTKSFGGRHLVEVQPKQVIRRKA
jgi:hypothetical protein